MPRVKKHIAKFDTYRQGARIPSDTKKGYRIDRSRPFDENDTLFCKKGEVYYSWNFRYGGTHRSKTYPRPSQLTSSDFLQQAYEMVEQIEDFESNDLEEIKEFVETIREEAEELMELTDESLNNMPESLQYSPNGELLQERVDALSEFIDQLYEIDESESAEEAIDELKNIYLEV